MAAGWNTSSPVINGRVSRWGAPGGTAKESIPLQISERKKTTIFYTTINHPKLPASTQSCTRSLRSPNTQLHTIRYANQQKKNNALLVFMLSQLYRCPLKFATTVIVHRVKIPGEIICIIRERSHQELITLVAKQKQPPWRLASQNHNIIRVGDATTTTVCAECLISRFAASNCT